MTTAFPKLSPLIEYLDGLEGRADLAVLERLLAEADLTVADIESACQFGQKGYKRNIIKRTAWYELLALCWRSGDCTPIHDHRGVSCAFRVIQGEGTEIRFERSASGLMCPVQISKMSPGYICAAVDEDIHQVANMQPPGADLVTVHIYSPPISQMGTYQFTSPSVSTTEQYAGAEELRQYVGSGAGI